MTDAMRLVSLFLKWLDSPSPDLSPWLPALVDWAGREISPIEARSIRSILFWLAQIDAQAAFYLRPWISRLAVRSPRHPRPRTPSGASRVFRSNLVRLELLTRFRRGSLPRAKTFVEPASHQIVRNGHRTRSLALARAIEALHGGAPLTARELMRMAYGFADYDPEFHQEKLFSLLSRLRRTLGQTATIFFRSGVIYWEGDRRNVVILPPTDWAQILSESEGWHDFLSSLRPLRIRQRGSIYSQDFFAKVADRGVFQRADLQTLGSISRSSAHRLIQRWILKGWIRPHREGRIVVYRLTRSSRRTSLG